MDFRKYIEELKRRHVFRAGLAYLVVAWLIMQVASIVLPTFEAPSFVMKTILFALLIGFPIFLILAWIYDVTPEGIKKTDSDGKASHFAPQINRRLNWVILGSFLVVVALLFINQFQFNPFENFQKKLVPEAEAIRDDSGQKSIAVLPFVNMSGDPGQEYFSDGMSEEIINALAQIKGLKVSGRTSSFSFKGKDVTLSQIGKALHVNTILEGSVQKSGDRLRITVQLINVADEYHIWSERFDRKMADVFAIQDDISTRVAEKMKITMAGEKSDSLTAIKTADLEAYELLLRGRYFREQGVEGLEKSAEYLKKAIAVDSGYARAYGELAATYFLLSIHKFIAPQEGFGKMLIYGEKAVKLDPDLPFRHIGMAYFHFWVTWDWNAALDEYEKEMSLGTTPGMFYPLYQTYIYGNFEEAIPAAEIVIHSDPLNIDLLRSMAEIYAMAGRYDDSREVLNKILELNPSYSEAFRLIGSSHLSEAQYDSAMHYFNRAAEISQGKGYTGTDIIIALALSGQKEEAQGMFSDLLERDSAQLIYAFEMANIYYCFGEIDKTFEWLNRAYDSREFWLVSLNTDPGWDGLRADPRFKSLIDKMNFPKQD